MNQMPPFSGKRKRSIVGNGDMWEEEEDKQGFRANK
jgi:hypothetical protein